MYETFHIDIILSEYLIISSVKSIHIINFNTAILLHLKYIFDYSPKKIPQYYIMNLIS